MAKKIKPRDLRESKRQEKLAAYSVKANEKKTVHTTEEKPAAVLTVTASENKKNKKTSNKAAGLKSTLVYGNKLYITSFGKGNEAIIEQKVDTSDYSFSDVRSDPSLKIKSADDVSISFSSERPFINKSLLTAVNPLHSGKDKPKRAAGQDMLGLKSELEKRYFGKTFDDNIHIQLIHNILDIEKIFAVYSANIVAALDHMIDGDDREYLENDFIGYMNTLNTYEVFMEPSKVFSDCDNRKKNIDKSREKFETLIDSKRLRYFGFEYDPDGKNKNEEMKKRLYHLVAFAGQLRQWSFHSEGNFKLEWLYKLDDSRIAQEYRDTLDYFFDRRFDELNNNFVEQNATNLFILKETFPGEDLKAVADLYYDFIIVKSQKNIGFSIKKLREKMLETEEAAPIKAHDMDSYRPKLYKLIDFCIFKHYHEYTEISEKNVDTLRAAVSEEQKEKFYADEAKRLWGIFDKQFLGFCKKINVWVNGSHEKEILGYIDKDAYRKKSDVSYFSKFLYAMSFFLDGKEINDLLTTLINKFDNIASFISTAKELDAETVFVENYAFFNKSDRYVSELNIVKNISRMKKPAAKAKKEMYRDALMILGVPSGMDDEALDAEIDRILEKKLDPVTGKPLKGKNSFRNFIANNVIENKRFIYVIKFCNPKNVRKLVNNTKVTEFVLKRMPESQIDRYYSSCIDTEKNPSVDKKISDLAEMIKKIAFDDFRNVRQKTRTREESLEKERFKAVIGLYLTVVYLLIKNLVNVNSRYVMAFHCLERDAKLYGINIGKNYIELTEVLCRENENSRSAYLARNKRLRDCVKQNIDNAKKWSIGEKFDIIRSYRNKVAHLTVVRRCDEFIGDITKIDSYFALYHYLVQRLISEGLDPKRSGFERNYPQYVPLFKYHTYVKDMVKALNSPFGYNIPRFKNLSIDALFDRNETKEIKDDDDCKKLDK